MNYKYFQNYKKDKRNTPIIFAVFGFILLFICPAFPNETLTRNEENKQMIDDFLLYVNMLKHLLIEEELHTKKTIINPLDKKEMIQFDFVFGINKMNVSFFLRDETRKIILKMPLDDDKITMSKHFGIMAAAISVLCFEGDLEKAGEELANNSQPFTNNLLQTKPTIITMGTCDMDSKLVNEKILVNLKES